MLESSKYSCNILMQDLNLTRRTHSSTLTPSHRESATYDFDQSNYRMKDAIITDVLLRYIFMIFGEIFKIRA